jgi:hypothetical protein
MGKFTEKLQWIRQSGTSYRTTKKPRHDSCLANGHLWEGGFILLSRKFPLPLFFGALLLAGSASALSTTYGLLAGSTMTTVNGGGSHSIALTGSITLDDDGVGNVTITNLSLSHGAFQIGSPPLVSVVTNRPSIVLGSGPVAGTGSTLTSATFATATTVDQSTGTLQCDDGLFTCAGPPVNFPGPAGVPLPLTSPLGLTFGTFNFTGLGTNLSAVFQYGPTVAGSTDTVTLVATVPEPGTLVLLAAGLVGFGIRRRHSASV